MGKENLRPWKKGQSGNPGGRPKLPPEMRRAAQLTPFMFRARAGKYLAMPLHQLAEIVKDTKTESMDAVIARIILTAARDGDYMRLNFLLDRLIGKVKEDKEVTINVSSMSDQELLEASKEAIKVLEAEVVEKDTCGE